MGVTAPHQVTPVYWTTFPAHALSGTNWSDHRSAHLAVMRLFPTRMPGAEPQRRATSGVLYRLDTHPDQPATVLVQSLLPPELIPAQARVLTLPDHVWDAPADTSIAFRVAVCPIRRHKLPKGRPGGERTIVVPDSGLEQWVTQKLSGALTKVEILNISTRTTTAHQPASHSCPPRVNLATIDGVARVDDAANLDRLRVHGVGRAKAYGAGLLTTRQLN